MYVRHYMKWILLFFILFFFWRFRLDRYIGMTMFYCCRECFNIRGIIDILRDLMDIVWTWNEFTLWEKINGLHLTTLEYVISVLCSKIWKIYVYISILICSIINLERSKCFLYRHGWFITGRVIIGRNDIF